MDNNIIFDIRNYIESKYPKLTLDEIDLIASDIQRRYDYAPIKSQVEERLQECAYYANIKLDDDCNNVEAQYGHLLDGEIPEEVQTIFSKLEGVVDKFYTEIENAQLKQPKPEWED